MMSVEADAKPDEVTMLAVLSTCAHLGEHELALIDMYANRANVKKAVELFENMETRSVATWSTVISYWLSRGVLVTFDEAANMVKMMPSVEEARVARKIMRDKGSQKVARRRQITFSVRGYKQSSITVKQGVKDGTARKIGMA
ncbi:hypothetical protein HAX54_037033 [Datura stramonium]|uniref:Pentatricopeptide repeat-containing protein n=1 Tax=Datura stramonium TaxID=4076 RepID=A0ABS8VKR4_DATST|nr:hypothetical protein [Datura stramonium]